MLLKKHQEGISFRDIDKFETNPFVVELKGKMYLRPSASTIIAQGEAIVDTITGEMAEGSLLIGRRKVVDKSEFAKLYASEIGVLFELSKNAINVFIHIAKVMDYENKSYFSYTEEFGKIGYKSKHPAMNGLKELIKNNIIASSTKTNQWWLNPTIVCKGERFSIYTEYVQANGNEANKIAKETMKYQIEARIDALDSDTKQKKEFAERQASLF